MAFQSIAYGPDALSLLTVDGQELLAHDAQSEAPKWRLTLARPAVAVLFVDAMSLPGGQGGNPWRSQATTQAALVVDVEGHLHLVDTSLGQSIGTLGPFGKPLAVASSPGASVIALAVDDTVLVWCSGERVERPIPLRASALAFSADGATLAVGTEKGELRMFHVAAGKGGPNEPLEETFRGEVRGAIADLAQHPDGTWLACGAQGVHSVTESGVARLERIPAGIRRLRFDAKGARLAVQRSEKAVLVYAWPSLSVVMRVEYTERPVRGLMFGADDWLGVALDHGDGNKIDIETSAVHRTDTHPGRQHRSWTLLVEGKRETLSAKEAEDVRRMKDPFHQPPPDKTSSALGGRIGIGAMISLALLGVRVCVRASSPSPSFNYTPPPSITGAIRPVPAARHARLVHLKGAGLDETVETLPERVNPIRGETPRAIWTAPDGTVFVACTAPSYNDENKNVVYRRKTTGVWDKTLELLGSSGEVVLSGRSASDVWYSTGTRIEHYDGTSWTDVEPPAISTVTGLNGDGADVLVTGSDPQADAPTGRVYRRRGTTWVKEAPPASLGVTRLFAGAPSLLAVAEDSSAREVLLQRSAGGTWAIRTPRTDAGASELRAAWVSPTGDIFTATDEAVMRASGGTSTELPLADPIDSFWGRSSSDLYAVSAGNLVHYDGKKWSEAAYSGAALAISGTATEVLVLRTDE